MNTTPRASEFKGLYNIDPTFVGPTVATGEEDYLCIREGLGPPGVAEVDGVADLIVDFAKDVSGSPTSVSYSVGFDDRTAFLTFRETELLTVDNLENLRERLKGKVPDWRIVVCGVSDLTTIVIYPSRVVLPQDGDARRIVEEVRSHLADERERTVGVHERQVAYIARKLQYLSIPPIPYEPIVLAAFDSVMGNYEEIAVWILQSGYAHHGLSWLPGEDWGDGFLGKCGSSEFDVTDGRVLVGFMEAEESFVGNVKAFAYAKSWFSDEIILVNPKTREIQRRKISKNDVLSDDEVKIRLARSEPW